MNVFIDEPVFLRYELQRRRRRRMRPLRRRRRRRGRRVLPPLPLLRLGDLGCGRLQRRAARHEVEEATAVLPLLLRLAAVKREAEPV